MVLSEDPVASPGHSRLRAAALYLTELCIIGVIYFALAVISAFAVRRGQRHVQG